MSSIRLHKPNKALFFDFNFMNVRCREYTHLPDTQINRKKLQKILDRIEAEIAAGTFVYANYFPESKTLNRLEKQDQSKLGHAKKDQPAESFGGANSEVASFKGPLFKDFSTQWFDERSIEWRRSHIRSLLSTLNGHLVPNFGERVVGSITKSDVLEFRATLAKVKGRGTQEGISNKRINEIMGLLRQILNEAADRFEFTSPMVNIKKLRQRKTDVDPFNLTDVQNIISTVRADFKNYFVTRFLTGMRTGEVHGLKWKYVDFDLRIIRVRETFVLGEDEYTKTDGSQRDIQMSQPVFDALKTQFEATGQLSEYVFCNQAGQPLDNKNFSDRVWYPLLRNLGLAKRRPYQMRHTAATLWLASGEAPEWIARQLGHTSTEMLFRVYSRFVPNLTRQDGSAMERLLASQLTQLPLIAHKATETEPEIYVPAKPAFAPKPTQPTQREVKPVESRLDPAKSVEVKAIVVPPAKPPSVERQLVKAAPKPTSHTMPAPITWASMANAWKGKGADVS